jgi:hypothetical protein
VVGLAGAGVYTLPFRFALASPRLSLIVACRQIGFRSPDAFPSLVSAIAIGLAVRPSGVCTATLTLLSFTEERRCRITEVTNPSRRYKPTLARHAGLGLRG